MSKKKPVWIIVLVVLLVLITAATIYVNRVVLPVQIKNIAVTQAKNFLNRNVTIGDLHFSWVKGLILDDVTVFQKNSSDIFFQSKRISVGIIFIPGFKEHQLTIPFVDIANPEVRLERKGAQEWNFSDLLTPQKSDNSQPSNIKVTLLGIHIQDGHIAIDDKTGTTPFHQDLDQVNLNVGLSASGISIDSSLNMTKTAGAISVKGTYQPLTKSLDGHLFLKNITLSQYLAFLPAFPGITIANGHIKEINLDAHYDANLYSVKGDINATDIDVKYGNMAFIGNIETNINQCDIRNNSINIDASITAQNAALTLSPTQILKGTVSFEKAKIRQDKDGIQFVGTINAQDIDATFEGKKFRGNLLARPMTMQMKNENDIDIQGDLRLTQTNIALDDTHSFSGKISVNEARVHVINKTDITFDGAIALEEMDITPADHVRATGSVELKNIAFALSNDMMKIKTNGELNNWQVNLDKDKTIVAETSFSVDATYPIKRPEALAYTGTFNIEHADITGYPYGPIKEITARGDFKTDQISLKLFSFMALESGFKGAATIMNLKNPVLSVEVASEHIDLGKIKDIVPEIYGQYGLETTGKASFAASFEGLASAPLSGKINVSAQLQDVNVASTKFNQHVEHINGSINGTPDTLAWKDFNGTYLGKNYTLTGSLKDFKAPSITTTLNGDDIKLDTTLTNKGNDWEISKFIGKYFDVLIDASGKVTLPKEKPPVIDIQTSIKLNIEKSIPLLPEAQRQQIQPLGLKGDATVEAHVGGSISDWKTLASNATIKIPLLTVMGYHASDIAITLNQHDGKISNTTIDATAYSGKIHNVVNLDLTQATMPFDLALNIDALDLSVLQNDIPSLKGKNLKGKFYLTTVNEGVVTDIKKITGKGSLAIREGFLTEFKFFEGLLGILNDVMRLGQLTITDVEGNFTIGNQKITTDNLRLKSPTIVLLTEGWVDLDQKCDLNVTVDMTSGVIPPIAEQVLRTLNIHIYDKISAPKFDKKISVPQVINSVLKTIGIFQ